MGWILYILTSVVCTFVRGLLIQQLYNWFILSQFHGLPHLSVAACLGLSVFIQAICAWNLNPKNQIEQDDLRNSFVLYVIQLLIVYIFGVIVHWFM